MVNGVDLGPQPHCTRSGLEDSSPVRQTACAQYECHDPGGLCRLTCIPDLVRRLMKTVWE